MMYPIVDWVAYRKFRLASKLGWLSDSYDARRFFRELELKYNRISIGKTYEHK